MDTVRLGGTRPQVSPIRSGTWQFGGDWAEADQRAAIVGARGPRHLDESLRTVAQTLGPSDLAAERTLGPEGLAEIGRITSAAAPETGPAPEGMR
jgi:hypothetical protein